MRRAGGDRSLSSPTCGRESPEVARRRAGTPKRVTFSGTQAQTQALMPILGRSIDLASLRFTCGNGPVDWRGVSGEGRRRDVVRSGVLVEFVCANRWEGRACFSLTRGGFHRALVCEWQSEGHATEGAVAGFFELAHCLLSYS